MRKLFILSFLLVSRMGFSQDTLTYFDCPTSSFYFSEVFKKQFWANDLDSARMTLDVWIKNCGEREVTVRAKILLDITELGAKMTLPEGVFYYLEEFMARDSLEKMNQKYFYEYNRPKYGFIPIGEYFDDFTKLEFTKIHHIDDPELNFVRKVYSGNYQNFYEELDDLSLKNTSIANTYNLRQSKRPLVRVGHSSISVGAWIPVNKGSILGTHPEFGIQGGIKLKKWSFDLGGAFRVVESSNEYMARRKDSDVLESTKHYFGGFFGFDVGYDLLSNSKNVFQINTGVALDGFDALQDKGELNSAGVYTFDFNYGFEYRRRYTSERYWGLKLRYHMVDYSRGHTVDFKEQPISISLVYGLVRKHSNRYRPSLFY